MKKSIKLYDKTNFEELFDLLTGKQDESKLVSNTVVDELRSQLREEDEEQQYELIDNLICDVDQGGISFLDLSQLKETWMREGADFWGRIKVPTVTLLNMHIHCDEYAFIVVDVDELRKNPQSGLGVHPIGDRLITAQKVFRDGTKFLAPFCPEYSAPEKLTECFSEEILSEAFKVFLANNLEILQQELIELLS